MKSSSHSKLRIIGGKWRGRNLPFPIVPGLRPTPNRVRETLFNWLQFDLQDACCLDLFAGSGALSFEALSRGARFACMIDQAPAALNQLQENAEHLSAQSQVQILKATIPQNLSQLVFLHPFNIVFLDPPFHQNLITPCIEQLEQLKCLAPQAWIYIEAEVGLALSFPSHWEVVKAKKAGAVAYYLVKRIQV
ncbi:MAG: 16S rRNA (guanine(966)-N(2))-methyltransferase RsmD [Gammaproteobacteria bacterium]